jgi:hypothetical protein
MQRVKINKEGNQVSLTFNDSLYPKNFIEVAIRDFHEVCDVKINKNELILRPSNPQIDVTALGYEFYNYVLGLIKG